MKIYEYYQLVNRSLSSGDNQKLALILEEITILILLYLFENFSQLSMVKAA
ncbi:hypothetical protein PN437_11880 [Microcystis aeruginosa CS-564/01]|uniref:hypothetical protein n=1 Tax=Microcystis aeruginosa TaxID=1126 RepID=UPI00232B9C20|nr:hypothetical protein [Microcystis aeruginosa]MDB9425585.1 hypothetical protein [Microcystis aeruginosa CS-564/01]